MSSTFSTKALLDQLKLAGVELYIEDSKLRYNAPKGVMNPDVLQELKARKAEILELLAAADAEPELRALPRTNKPGELTLSYAQQRIWFLDELEPENPFYNVTLAKRIRGQIDIETLKQSALNLLNRHEVMRSYCQTINDQAVLAVDNTISAEDAWFSVEDLPAGTSEAELTERINAEGRRPVRLSEAPLLRLRLFRLPGNDNVLVITTHHFVVDGWSCGLLMREISITYNALLSGALIELPTLPVQYADFAAWQNKFLKGPELKRQSEYWREQLHGITTLNLPTDLPRPPVQSYRGDIYNFSLPPELLAALKKLSQQFGVTLYMTLLAGFQSLLFRYTQQDDIVVGAAVSNRHFSSLEDLIGPFVNALVLRGTMAGSLSFRDVVTRARDTAADAFAHQDLPFEVLVEQLRPERDRSRSPLFQTLFVVHQYDADEELNIAGCECSDYPVAPGTTMYDVFLQLIEIDGRLSGSIEYSTDLFQRSTIERMARHLEVLLSGAAANPDQAILDLPLMQQAEREAVLTQWNTTATDYPRAAGVHQLVEQAAEQYPDNTAVVFADSSLSYRALNNRANQLAHCLDQQGIGRGDRVGIYLERCTDMLVAMLGILKAGAAYVPLDPAFPDDRVSYMMSDAGMAAVVIDSRQPVVLPETSARAIDLATTALNEFATTALAATTGFADSTELAYMIYTSGSTGLPKGVQLPHQSVVNFLCTMQQTPGMKPNDVLVAVTTLSFDIAVLELLLPLISGATVVIASREVSSDGQQLAKLISDSNTTVMQATPATWRLLLNENWPGHPGLKILCGGEGLPRSLADRILATGSELWNMYGPTETTIWSSISKVAATGPVTIGKPIANTTMYILDDNLEPQPAGIPGELCIGGEGLAVGYFKRDELTAEKFIADPFDKSRTGARIYRTGDLARYLPNGEIECLGRNDHQIKIRGFRMELGEIETALTAHNAVKESVVTAHEYREGDTRLVAYLVTDEAGISNAKIAQWKAEHLEQWKDLWEGAYVDGGEVADPRFNISGWKSSYTGTPIPAAEMRQWVDSTAARINALNVGRVLEVGAGTGLFVSTVAPQAISYLATDFSPASMRGIAKLAASYPDLANVSTLQTPADQLMQLKTGSFDTAILNSVAQYFPDADYLTGVIHTLVELVVDGGQLFLGDIRNALLLQEFHSSIQFAQADDGSTLEQLAQRIRQRMEQEEELLLAPAYFAELVANHPRLASASFRLKQGHARNELTRFRYDVVLQVSGNKRANAKPASLDWQSGKLDLNALQQQLTAGIGNDGLSITGIPDARLSEETKLTALLSQQPQLTVAAARAEVNNTQGGIEADDLFALAQATGSNLQLIATTAGFMTAWFTPAGSGAVNAAITGNPDVLANDPMTGRLQRSLIPELRESLRQRLPEYMVPSIYSILKSLPLTPNGKIDRKALPVPEAQITQTYVPPDTDTEKTLTGIWEEILSAGQVGIDDDFFDLGGHSLLATQLISRVRETFKINLPLNTLFESPTVRGIAAAVDTLIWGLNAEPQFAADADIEEFEL
jgi:amino acid adenylation domain-containing protein